MQKKDAASILYGVINKDDNKKFVFKSKKARDIFLEKGLTPATAKGIGYSLWNSYIFQEKGKKGDKKFIFGR